MQLLWLSLEECPVWLYWFCTFGAFTKTKIVRSVEREIEREREARSSLTHERRLRIRSSIALFYLIFSELDENKLKNEYFSLVFHLFCLWCSVGECLHGHCTLKSILISRAIEFPSHSVHLIAANDNNEDQWRREIIRELSNWHVNGYVQAIPHTHTHTKKEEQKKKQIQHTVDGPISNENKSPWKFGQSFDSFHIRWIRCDDRLIANEQFRMQENKKKQTNGARRFELLEE